MKRREFLARSGVLASSVLAATQLRNAAQAQNENAATSGSALVIDPKPLFEISPHLYMQFMEPLGVTDSSVEAAWDYNRDDWRKDFVDVTKDLAPGMIRYGGLLSRYYKWREGIGPAEKRPWFRNYVWGGKEPHRVGTHEFVDFCRRVNAEPMYCVNFRGDGEKRYATTPEGDRTGDEKEAADWVSYCNDPDHAERKANGHAAPFNLKMWQLGNETSYGSACFKKDEAIDVTIRFTKAMRERDRGLKLIAWGDDGWAPEMVGRAGEHFDYIAAHTMQQTPVRRDTVLRSWKYQAAPEQAWSELMEMVAARIEKKLLGLINSLSGDKAKMPIAITEGHLSLAPHNSNPILTEWLTGVYHARAMNLYQRHGDRVKIATTADFNGNRWTTNAVLHQVPSGVSYLLPAGAVARLFARHNGKQGVAVKSTPTDLDVVASRSGDKLFLHVANMNFHNAVEASFAVDGMHVSGGRVIEINPENPRQEISPLNPDVFKGAERQITAGDRPRCRFPARSVAVVELDCRAA
ncbi:MAG TPA: alpha-L-arabinofuranosidase [Verrucomicrobiae bacterium]